MNESSLSLYTINAEWTLVSRKKQIKKPEKVICTGIKSGEALFHAVKKRKWIYVGEIAGRKTTVEEVEKYMKQERNFEEVQVKKLDTKGENSAFTVGVTLEEDFTAICKELQKFFSSREKIHNKEVKPVETDKIKIFHINIQCLNTSFNGLLEYNNKEEFDFLAITEHWQSKEQLINYYIDGYRQITGFCREERKHGDVELFFGKLTDILEIIVNGRVVILGDLNIDILKENDKSSKVFFTIMESFGINILVRVPTRITYHSATCLDNVCTNIEGGSVQVVRTDIFI